MLKQIQQMSLYAFSINYQNNLWLKSQFKGVSDSNPKKRFPVFLDKLSFKAIHHISGHYGIPKYFLFCFGGVGWLLVTQLYEW